MTFYKLFVSVAFAASLAACSTSLHLAADQMESARTRLLGKWQVRESQFEFFADGSIAMSRKSRRGWDQFRTSTFKFLDSTHIKIEGDWRWATIIFKLDWQHNDHVTLHSGDSMTDPLHRVNQDTKE